MSAGNFTIDAQVQIPTCSCDYYPKDESLEHWCGWKNCHSAREGEPWQLAENPNHLAVCHEACWRKDAFAVVKNFRDAGEPIDTTGHLRLCHRRCYVNDLMRRQAFQETAVLDPVEEKKKYVPCHRTLVERVSWPQVQHRWARRCETMWEVPQLGCPWPRWGLGRRGCLRRCGVEEGREWVEQRRRGVSERERRRFGMEKGKRGKRGKEGKRVEEVGIQELPKLEKAKREEWQMQKRALRRERRERQRAWWMAFA